MAATLRTAPEFVLLLMAFYLKSYELFVTEEAGGTPQTALGFCMIAKAEVDCCELMALPTILASLQPSVYAVCYFKLLRLELSVRMPPGKRAAEEDEELGWWCT